VTVTRSNAPTELDRDRATAAAYMSVVEDLGSTEVSGSSDYETGAITITYASSLNAKAKVPAVKDKAKKKATEALGLEAQVSFAESTIMSEAGPEYRGGVPYPGGCTGGFVVRSGSTYGIASARHCTYTNFSYDGGTFVFQAQLPTTQGDIRWSRSTSGGVSSSFQYYPNMFRLVNAAVSPAVGTFVCKYGPNVNDVAGCSRRPAPQ
jgi:hypothetical protein